jgi:hypothetical protein
MLGPNSTRSSVQSLTLNCVNFHHMNDLIDFQNLPCKNLCFILFFSGSLVFCCLLVMNLLESMHLELISPVMLPIKSNCGMTNVCLVHTYFSIMLLLFTYLFV